jgi:chitinase
MNFLSFLQELRHDPIGRNLVLTAATATVPFANQNGSPSSNVAGFSKVLDFIAIMNYDIWGPWSPTVGPNAPLDDTCAAANNQAGSGVSAVKLWNKAGIPRNQIVLGVPSYGHSFRVLRQNAFKPGSTTVLTPYPKFDANNPPSGDSWDNSTGTDVCGAKQSVGGIVNFWGLIQLGYLNSNGMPKKGIAYAFDNCSQTVSDYESTRHSFPDKLLQPFVYNQTTQVMVSFDNAQVCPLFAERFPCKLMINLLIQSFAAKGRFIKSTGLRGFAMWEAGGDYNNILINSIRHAAGFKY